MRRQYTPQNKKHYFPYFLPLFLFFLFVNPHHEIQGTEPDTAERFGGRLVLATVSDPKTFNPIVAQETSSTQILNFLFEGLTKTDPKTGAVIPNLAQAWSHDETGKVWTVNLRPDVVWSDGTPFTAHDVVFTFNEIIYNPTIITGYKSILTIDGCPIVVRALDDVTLRFTLPSLFAPFLRALSLPIMPRHVLRDAVGNNTFNEAWGIRELPQRIIGTGPFMLGQYRPGGKVILRRNPYYWRRDAEGNRLPYLAEIIFLIIQSQDIALLKFKNQEIDMYGLRGIDYPWLKPIEEKGYFTIYDLGPTMSRYFLAFNQNNGVNPHTGEPYMPPDKNAWFTNRNFRHAIAHCINRRQIIDLVYNGLATPQHATMSPASGYFYNPDVVRYEFNREKARAILAGEGFRDRNNDGILEDKDGNTVSFNVYLSAGAVQTTHLANLIRKDLSQLGCEVNLIQVEFNTLVNKLSFTFDWDVVLIGLTGGIEPHFGANVWFSHGPLHMWHPRQKQPATEWERRIDEIFLQGVQELDESHRKPLYDEWQRIVADEVPVIFTVIPSNLTAVNNRLQNVKPTPLGGVLHNVEEIYIRQETTDHRQQT